MASAKHVRKDKTESVPLRFPFDTKASSRRLVTWYRKNRRPLPWRELFAQHADPYHVWISEIMLQQTVIKAVIPAYARFLEKYPNVRALAATDEESLRLAVRGLGYYRRFDFLLKAAKVITNDLKGRWPTTFDEWKTLPGIGNYTAAAISSIAFGESAAVVDGNVERVFCRLLDLRMPPNLPELKRKFQILADELLYRRDPGSHNQAVMELGQTVCTVTAPNCDSCPLSADCLSFAAKSQHLAPAAKLKKEFQDLHLRLHIHTRGQLVGLLRRPQDARFLGGTRGFFTQISAGDNHFSSDGVSALVPPERKAMGRIKHSITHHRIAADVIVHPDARIKGAEVEWIPVDKVEESLVSNLDRKAWRVVEKAGLFDIGGR